MSKLLDIMNIIGFVKEDIFYRYENYEIILLMSDDNKPTYILSYEKSHIDMDFIIETNDVNIFIEKLKEVFKYRFRADKISKLLNY